MKAYPIWINNHSAAPVYYLLSYSYPDTAITDQYTAIGSCVAGSSSPAEFGKPWEKIFSREIPGGKLIIFFFDRYPANNEEFRQMREDYSIVKRFELSLAELKANNWNVDYP